MLFTPPNVTVVFAFLAGKRSVCSIFLLIASCAGYTYYDQGKQQQQPLRQQ
jgi:hypothetical protein